MKKAVETEIEEERPELVTAAATMLGDLMKIVIDLAKALPKPWLQLSEKEQENWIFSVDNQCRQAIEECVQIISTRAVMNVAAVVESVTFKDGVKVVLKVLSRSEGAHAIADAEGEQILVCLPDAGELVSPEGKPAADPDPKGLELNDNK